MTALHLLYLVASSLVVLALLFFGTFGLLFCERFVQARTQHRDGPGRGGKIDYLQVWTDFLKVRRKSGHAQQIISGRFRAIFAIWIFLPMLFLLVLLAPIIPEQVASAELPIMLVLPLIAAGIEALFIHATSDARERYDWRKHLMLRVMGATVLYLSVAAVGLRVGHSNLEAISDLQSRFPFHSILSSPGLLLCGLGAFSAIFIFAAESPVEGRLEMSLNRSMQYVLFFVNKMWIFCLLCFWVFLFLGGLGSLVPKLLFPLKAGIVLFLFSLIQVSFPRVRSSDAIEITARWILRLCLIGFLLEVIWVGVWK